MTYFSHYRNPREVQFLCYGAAFMVGLTAASWSFALYAWLGGWGSAPAYIGMFAVGSSTLLVILLARTEWDRRHDPILEITEDTIRVLDRCIEGEDVVSIAWDSDRTTGFKLRSGQTAAVDYGLIPKRLRAEARSAVVEFGSKHCA